jgi:hypothetical protein
MGKKAKQVNAKADADTKGRATQQLARGHISPANAAKVRHRADVVLGEVDSTYHHGSPKGRK